MNRITFDTYKIVRRLTSEGISEKQATVIVDAIQEGRELDLSHVATKTDLAELKAELLKWYVGIAMVQTVTFIGGIIAIAKIVHGN